MTGTETGDAVADVDLAVLDQRVDSGVAQLFLPCPEALRNARAGTFALLKSRAPGAPLLPRPLSIVEAKTRLGFVYNVVGPGTRALAAASAGDTIAVVGPLGRPFGAFDDETLIVADGEHAGTALAMVHRRQAAGKGKPNVLFVVDTGSPEQDARARRLAQLFTDYGADTRIVPPSALRDALEVAAPVRLAAAASDATMAVVQRFALERSVPGEVSLHAKMACGLAACHACARRFRDGALRLVCEGPVFDLTAPQF